MDGRSLSPHSAPLPSLSRNISAFSPPPALFVRLIEEPIKDKHSAFGQRCLTWNFRVKNFPKKLRLPLTSAAWRTQTNTYTHSCVRSIVRAHARPFSDSVASLWNGNAFGAYSREYRVQRRENNLQLKKGNLNKRNTNQDKEEHETVWHRQTNRSLRTQRFLRFAGNRLIINTEAKKKNCSDVSNTSWKRRWYTIQSGRPRRFYPRTFIGD